MLWPTPGGLSRREWAAASPAELRRSASWVELDELVVDGDAALALRDRLEREFAAKSGQLAHRPRFRMDFVPADRSYWFGNTCADVAAAWLRQLGCTVGWVPIRASLRT